jgi:hypothetical protein
MYLGTDRGRNPQQSIAELDRLSGETEGGDHLSQGAGCALFPWHSSGQFARPPTVDVRAPRSPLPTPPDTLPPTRASERPRTEKPGARNHRRLARQQTDPLHLDAPRTPPGGPCRAALLTAAPRAYRGAFLASELFGAICCRTTEHRNRRAGWIPRQQRSPPGEPDPNQSPSRDRGPQPCRLQRPARKAGQLCFRTENRLADTRPHRHATSRSPAAPRCDRRDRAPSRARRTTCVGRRAGS